MNSDYNNGYDHLFVYLFCRRLVGRLVGGWRGYENTKCKRADNEEKRRRCIDAYIYAYTHTHAQRARKEKSKEDFLSLSPSLQK